MSDDERVLRSFVADDEEPREFLTVTAAKYSKGRIPPAGGEETVAVTDRRLLWFRSELETVPLDDVEDVEREYVERVSAPPIVLGGGLLFVLGIFASIGAVVAGVGDTLVVAMPAMTGLAAFLGTRVFASVTGREGETRAGHRLRLWTGDGPVSIWGEEATLETIAAAIPGEPDLTADTEDPDRAATDDDSTDTPGIDGNERDVGESDVDETDGSPSDGNRSDESHPDESAFVANDSAASGTDEEAT